jgi:hypothetical protein
MDGVEAVYVCPVEERLRKKRVAEVSGQKGCAARAV